jgi:hypothetical protein
MAAKVAAMTHLLARFGLVLSLAFAGTTAMSDTLNIWAASSLKTALDDVVRLWSGDARIVYAGTRHWPARSKLARRQMCLFRPMSHGWIIWQHKA